jgi:hypothetical protein
MMWLISAVFFVAAVTAGATAVYQQKANALLEANHVREVASINKVGKWYQDRVVELEAENRNLAEQIVNSLGHPAVAMPRWPDSPQEEYAYDQTGLVRETLDPREVT